MKLNLGCGSDLRKGYVNVDFFALDATDYDDGVQRVDLSKFPWPWQNESADEVMMLDFLEHFPYKDTKKILSEAYRVLRHDGKIVVQVPDFEECAKAMMWWDYDDLPYNCNKCGFEFSTSTTLNTLACGRCGQHRDVTAEAGMNRLFGGQDRDGNWHYAAFTKRSLTFALQRAGFESVIFAENNQNGETYRQNWNMYAIAHKPDDEWRMAL